MYARETVNFPLEIREFDQAGTPKINARTDPAIPSSDAVELFDGPGFKRMRRYEEIIEHMVANPTLAHPSKEVYEGEDQNICNFRIIKSIKAIKLYKF